MRKSWIIVGFTVVLAISLSVLIIEYQPIDNTQQSMAESWMFKGAYATYEGQIDSLSIPISLDETIQVTDLNFTHVQIQTNSSIATSFAPTLSDQTTLWVNKTNINFQPKGETLKGTYNTQITVRNIGSRDCIAYDYTNQAINATYYIDKALQWPVRIVYATTFENQTYQIEFNLKDTNINGLK
jgi:hypothetical protein